MFFTLTPWISAPIWGDEGMILSMMNGPFESISILCVAAEHRANNKPTLSFPRRREPITQCHLRPRMGSRLRGNDSGSVVACCLHHRNSTCQNTQSTQLAGTDIRHGKRHGAHPPHRRDRTGSVEADCACSPLDSAIALATATSNRRATPIISICF